MSISYLRIKRTCALRLAQIIGTSQSTLETAYTGSWASMLDGAEIPKTAFKDMILATEKELAQDIGNNPQHPARTLLYAQSASLSDLNSTPAVDSNGYEFVGVFDSCSDASDNKPCTYQPTQVITDIVDNGSSFFQPTNYYFYNITGNYIRTTRSSVVLQGCSWDYTTRATAYDADGNSPLPEALETVWADGVAMRAAQVGWVDGDKAGYFANLYEQGRQMFMAQTPNIPLASLEKVAG